MKKSFIIVSTIFFLLGITIYAQEANTKSQSKERLEAERIWEQMVEAKGGREKLNSVTNMMLTKGNNAPNNQTEFYVFPNRYWEWSKGKIVYDFTRIAMANLDLGVYLSANETGITHSEKFAPVSGGLNYRESWLTEACAFLLENHWLKPVPIKVTRQTVGKERLDVVDTIFPNLTTIKGWGLRYYVDPESLEVRYTARYDEKGNPFLFYYFEGQTTSFGIVVPKSYSAVLPGRDERTPKKGVMVPLTFQFNVNFNMKLFETAPSVKAGPNAWKP